jgi:hypothetical protein
MAIKQFAIGFRAHEKRNQICTFSLCAVAPLQMNGVLAWLTPIAVPIRPQLWLLPTTAERSAGHGCGRRCRGVAARTSAVIPTAMTTRVLITHHHRDALENAAARGFWMPLPLVQPADRNLMYLTAVSYGDKTIRALLEISSFEPWRSDDNRECWLPFTGQLLQLPRPLPLGDRGLLAGWLPRQRDAVQIVALDALLAVERLSDLLPGSGAACSLPRPLQSSAATSRRRQPAGTQLLSRSQLWSTPCCSAQAISPR